ncbi:MAG: ATP-binding protein [Propionibacteriales bacterium]|nr:ATP-binding protein [Propionibacteriales bacterium]
MADKDLSEFLRDFAAVAKASEQVERRDQSSTLSGVLSGHLGTSPSELAVVAEDVPAHRYADVDIAIEKIAAADPAHRLIGIGGGQMRWHMTLGDLLQMERFDRRMGVGQVEYVTIPVGPSEQRVTIGCGVHLITYAGSPVAIAQRRPNPKFGQPEALIEVLSPDREAIGALLDEVRALSLHDSVIRGQVVGLEPSDQCDAPSYTFLQRPELTEQDVILPDATMQAVTAHVLGIGEQADQLRKHGQHLKRGVLLHGAPGTGKTHTVRYLMSKARDHTVIVMSGPALAKIRDATTMARAMQPAIVVLEDCDLIAQSRDIMAGQPKPLLFELLDAMDGLDGDADITFVLTTNRVDDLEAALAQRPGRVDLAVEIPKPDKRARVALLRHYAAGTPFSDATIERMAGQTDGTTASFAKELVRRAVLLAVVHDEDPSDDHLERALGQLHSESQNTTRSLLGGADSATR